LPLRPTPTRPSDIARHAQDRLPDESRARGRWSLYRVDSGIVVVYRQLFNEYCVAAPENPSQNFSSRIPLLLRRQDLSLVAAPTECGRFLLLQLIALYSEKIFSRSRSFSLIHKCPSMGPPLRVRILEGFLFSFVVGRFI
jgi:hypothetical protein